jgi:hypothetical protein
MSQLDAADSTERASRTRRWILIVCIAMGVLALALPVAYYLRLRANEKAIVEAMERDDAVRVRALADSYPWPVKARSGSVTPLHWAVAAGYKDVAEILIRNGADVNARGEGGLTPLHTVAVRETKSFLYINGLCEAPSGATYFVAAPGRIVVELLVAKGADVNARNALGETPLHRAALWGQPGVAEALMAAGADVNAKSDDGKTPLKRAIECQNDEVAEVLRKAGAKESP